MGWLIENWCVLVGLICLSAFVVYCAYTFFGMPTAKQKQKVKEWLVWACIEAEKKLQSGTGQLKLREVWNLFCSVPSFSWFAKIVSFEVFSDWVSEALSEVKKMLIKNDTLAEYVYGERKELEVAKIKEQLGEQSV